MNAYRWSWAWPCSRRRHRGPGLVTGRAARAWTPRPSPWSGSPLAIAWFGDGRRGDRDAAATVAGRGRRGRRRWAGHAQVFGFVDRAVAGTPGREVLRGGAWIGALERLAVYVALVAGWAPGLAIVLAVKGLGRYPELRNQEDTGAAERFIIGTFTSVLWAVACAGLAVLAT